MRARRGQVAIYLVLVLVAIAILTVMNVGVYLSVTAKNTAINAGDAAAMAVARHQGELLNEIGELNLRHLQVLMPRIVAKGGRRSVAERLAEAANICSNALRRCFLGPVDGIKLGSLAAAEWGVSVQDSDSMTRILRAHAADVRSIYVETSDLYPEPWKGAWLEYADAIEQALDDGVCAGPENINFRNDDGGSFLTRKQFYSAIGGRSWCWFYFNARSLLNGYSSYLDWPRPDPQAPDEAPIDSEIYPLGLRRLRTSALELLGEELIVRLTGSSIPQKGDTPGDEFEESLLDDLGQEWVCYNTSYPWREWTEIDPDGKWRFPVVGKVQEKYDLRGCAAVCRVIKPFFDPVGDDPDDKYRLMREAKWISAAKPFGEVQGEDGSIGKVTLCRELVVPSQWEMHLVPVDTVGGRDLSTADESWVNHVRGHLPAYYENGPSALPDGCWYCSRLREWEQESVRSEGREFMKTKGETCTRGSGGATQGGGVTHGG